MTNSKSETKKLLFKILGIGLLIVGFVFLGFGIYDFVSVAIYNSSITGNEALKETNIIYSLLATPTLFSGFLFFILGFGKEKTNGITK